MHTLFLFLPPLIAELRAKRQAHHTKNTIDRIGLCILQCDWPKLLQQNTISAHFSQMNFYTTASPSQLTAPCFECGGQTEPKKRHVITKTNAAELCSKRWTGNCSGTVYAHAACVKRVKRDRQATEVCSVHKATIISSLATTFEN